MNKLVWSAAAMAVAGSGAFAQGANVPDNLEKLSNFQQTGVTEFSFFDQDGDYADGFRETLIMITLPSVV